MGTREFFLAVLCAGSFVSIYAMEQLQLTSADEAGAETVIPAQEPSITILGLPSALWLNSILPAVCEGQSVPVVCRFITRARLINRSFKMLLHSPLLEKCFQRAVFPGRELSLSERRLLSSCMGWIVSKNKLNERECAFMQDSMTEKWTWGSLVTKLTSGINGQDLSSDLKFFAYFLMLGEQAQTEKSLSDEQNQAFDGLRATALIRVVNSSHFLKDFERVIGAIRGRSGDSQSDDLVTTALSYDSFYQQCAVREIGVPKGTGAPTLCDVSTQEVFDVLTHFELSQQQKDLLRAAAQGDRAALAMVAEKRVLHDCIITDISLFIALRGGHIEWAQQFLTMLPDVPRNGDSLQVCSEFLVKAAVDTGDRALCSAIAIYFTKGLQSNPKRIEMYQMYLSNIFSQLDTVALLHAATAFAQGFFDVIGSPTSRESVREFLHACFCGDAILAMNHFAVINCTGKYGVFIWALAMVISKGNIELLRAFAKDSLGAALIAQYKEAWILLAERRVFPGIKACIEELSPHMILKQHALLITRLEQNERKLLSREVFEEFVSGLGLTKEDQELVEVSLQARTSMSCEVVQYPMTSCMNDLCILAALVGKNLDLAESLIGQEVNIEDSAPSREAHFILSLWMLRWCIEHNFQSGAIKIFIRIMEVLPLCLRDGRDLDVLGFRVLIALACDSERNELSCQLAEGLLKGICHSMELPFFTEKWFSGFWHDNLEDLGDTHTASFSAESVNRFWVPLACVAAESGQLNFLTWLSQCQGGRAIIQDITPALRILAEKFGHTAILGFLELLNEGVR